MDIRKILILLLVFMMLGRVEAQVSGASLVLTAEKREHLIQTASEYRLRGNYAFAIIQLDSILKCQPVDAPILLFKGDLLLQASRYNDAVATYALLMPLNYESVTTKINLSYALFMNHKPLKALAFAKLAWLESLPTNKIAGNLNKVEPASAQQRATNIKAIVNYFNAMLWNIKVKTAKKFLKQQQTNLDAAQLLLLNARLSVTGGDYKKGIQLYDELVKLYPNKSYIQEYTDVLLGKKQWPRAAEVMKSAKSYFPDSEYNSFLKRLKATTVDRAGIEMGYFHDIAQNTRLDQSLWWQQSDDAHYSLSLRVGSSEVTSAGDKKTASEYIHGGLFERWSLAWTGQTDINFQRIAPQNNENFIGVTGRQTIQFQPDDHHMMGIFYNSDILNYTASLYGQDIRISSLGYITHILFTSHDGFYSQGSVGLLNDHNSNIQFFGSLYHVFRTEPTIKAGLNCSVSHYRDNTVTLYFSPHKYFSTEVFAEYNTPLPNSSKFYFQLQAAAGEQRIEKQSWEPDYRVQAQYGTHLTHFDAFLRYQTSNAASANGTGYKFDWFTLGISSRL